MLAKLAPSKGQGFGGFPPSSNSGDIGTIVYAANAPSVAYLPANGQPILAADYPSYTQKFGRSPAFYVRQLPAPASAPLYTTSMNSQIGISPEGRYAAVPSTNGTNVSIALYGITGSVVTKLQDISLGTAKVQAGKTVKFTDGDRHLVAVTDGGTSPVVKIFTRTPGTDTFATAALTGPSISGSVWNGIECAITPDDCVLITRNASPYCAMLQIGASAYTEKTTGLPAMHDFPVSITRSKDGSRWLMAFPSSPRLRVYDYVGGVFTEIPGPTPFAHTVQSTMLDAAISPDGEWVAYAAGTIVEASITIRLWRRNAAGTGYVFWKGLTTRDGAFNRIKFTQDGNFLVAHYVGALSTTLFKVDDGAFNEVLTTATIAGYPATITLMNFAQNADLVAIPDTVSPMFKLFTSDPTGQKIPLPSYPSQGGGRSTLKPYVKVK